jgi:anti-sigma factor (TIGR02949 family)
MSSCDELRLKALRYLDDRLHEQELDDFRTHLEACSNCRANVETQLALSELLHRSRPLYSATPGLRARVAAAIDQRPASIGAAISGNANHGTILGLYDRGFLVCRTRLQ